MYWSEYQHHIEIQNLEPDTVYYYKCLVLDHRIHEMMERIEEEGREKDVEDEDEDEQKEEERLRRTRKRKRRILMRSNTNRVLVDNSTTFSFRTAPESASMAKTKVAILGDLGLFDHTKTTLGVLASRTSIDDIDSIVMVGDLSYANGQHR